ncbi:MAG: hypothetical protein R6U32_05685 [Candidatus Woesearchaeota archaeon]
MTNSLYAKVFQDDKMTDAPASIGVIGEPYIDDMNKRVKYFCTKTLISPEEVHKEFNKAIDMMKESNMTRVSMRSLVDFDYESDFVEAKIPIINKGKHMVYLGFLERERKSDSHILKLEDMSVESVLSSKKKTYHDLEGFTLTRLHHEMADQSLITDMVSLFNKSYGSYLIQLDEDQVKEMINGSRVYVAIDNHTGRVVSSVTGETAEIDGDEKIELCEVSEMATLRDYRGKGISTGLVGMLLREMENNRRIIYTESRACHLPINQLFANLNFRYGGRLEKHCVISGDKEINEEGPYENLNVWYRNEEGEKNG